MTETKLFKVPVQMDVIFLADVKDLTVTDNVVQIDGMIPTFCNKVEIDLEPGRSNVTLYRYRLKDDPPEEAYWQEADDG